MRLPWLPWAKPWVAARCQGTLCNSKRDEWLHCTSSSSSTRTSNSIRPKPTLHRPPNNLPSIIHSIPSSSSSIQRYITSFSIRCNSTSNSSISSSYINKKDNIFNHSSRRIISRRPYKYSNSHLITTQIRYSISCNSKCTITSCSNNFMMLRITLLWVAQVTYNNFI